MPVKRPKLPTEILLTGVAPGSIAEGEAGTYAPADGDVTVSIEGGDSGLFQTAKISLFDLEPDPDLPPGSPPVLVPAGSVDGPGPIGTAEGEAALASILFTAPTFPAQDSFSATAVMGAPTWPNPVRIPVTATLGGLRISTPTPNLLITQGGTATAKLLVKSLGGPDTQVSFSMVAAPQGIHLDPGTQMFTLPRGSQITAELRFVAQTDAPIGTHELQGLVFNAGGLKGDLDHLLTFTVAGVDTSIVWEEPTDLSIRVDKDLNAWQCGRIDDVLIRSDAIFVATNSGGIWGIDFNQPDAPAGCTTDDLDSPDFTCLAFGPDTPLQIFAGCAGDGGLFVGGFGNWVPVKMVDSLGSTINTGTIYRIAVLKQRRVIVLMTDNGVFWSNLPVSSNFFHSIPSLPPRAYTGVAVGPDETVVVSAWGNGVVGGFFRGIWSVSDLVLAPVVFNGDVNVKEMARTSLAACASNSNIIYGVAGHFAPGQPTDNAIYRILRSDDGGQTWQPLPNTAFRVVQNKQFPLAPDQNDMAGTTGWYTNCIAVDSDNPNLVAVGWANGPWISTDAASSGTTHWTLRYEQDGPGLSHHVHADLHTILFDASDATGRTIYAASDGGLMVTRDLAGDKGYQTSLNAHVRNLQFYSSATGLTSNLGVGGISASPVAGGLVAGPTQDNGNLYCDFDSDDSKAWVRLEGGDGVQLRFLANGMLVDVSPGDVKARLSRWDGAALQERTVVPVRPRGSSALVVKGDLQPVDQPHFRHRDSQQLMYAVAASEDLTQVRRSLYGLFVGDTISSAFWNLIAILPIDSDDQIVSVASIRGDQVFASTAKRRIFSVAPNQDPFELALTPTDAGFAFGIVVVRDALAFAIYEGKSTHAILQSDFFSWVPLGGNDNVARGIGLPEGEAFRALAVDRVASPQTLFAATDNRVFVSRDLGDTWLVAPKGLPKRVHCTSLAVGAPRKDGGRYLYLGTYGRSVWQARLG